MWGKMAECEDARMDAGPDDRLTLLIYVARAKLQSVPVRDRKR